MSVHPNTLLAVALLVAATGAQSSSASTGCSSTLTGDYAAPSVASDYAARLIATGLTSPRGIKFDTEGNLLVVEEGVGITALGLDNGSGSCVSVASQDTVISDASLNHGIELSPDGNTLYASSSDELYSWNYSPQERRVTSNATILVKNMEGTDHTSRTLLLSQAVPGMIVVNRGSFENFDLEAKDIESGHGQVKAFNISDIFSPLDFNKDGVLLGWGLRNDVGIAEEPNTGGIWSVENSGDQLSRSGEDIHENNPAEKLNFLGYLNGTNSSNQGQNFGYPDCFAAWQADDIPDFDGVAGVQFAPYTQNDTNNDSICGDRIAPRLVFQAHMAPLDIKFDANATQAWISFHGSWNRDDPVGYKVSVVQFADGEPVDASDSMTAATDIVSNADNSACPDNCFRPVGLAWDGNGRLFMSSDSTGEIYVITREEGEWFFRSRNGVCKLNLADDRCGRVSNDCDDDRY
jgi:glucose/arabinose dehydrogenase